jgi:hypothetical protein
MAAGPSLRDGFEFVALVWGTWQGKAGAASAILTVVGAVVQWFWKGWERWLPKVVRLGAGVSVAILLWAPFELWRQQRVELTATRDSVAAWRHRSDSLLVAQSDGMKQARSEAQRAERERNQQIEDRLARYVAECDTVLEHFRVGPAVPYGEAERWTSEVQRYLRREMPSKSYEVEFMGAVDRDRFSLSVRVAGQDEDELKARRKKLMEFIVQLRSR